MLQDGWLILGIVFCLLLGLEVAFRATYLARDAIAPSNPSVQTWPAFRRATSVLASAPWAEDYAREWDESLKTAWHPYVYWRRHPYEGAYVNIDKRGVTANPVSASHADLTVYAFGGSTMWGTGSRDQGTIASHLSRELNALGLGTVYVENWGESGYVSTQELIELYLLLREDHVPDVAVFLRWVQRSARRAAGG